LKAAVDIYFGEPVLYTKGKSGATARLRNRIVYRNNKIEKLTLFVPVNRLKKSSDKK